MYPKLSNRIHIILEKLQGAIYKDPEQIRQIEYEEGVRYLEEIKELQMYETPINWSGNNKQVVFRMSYIVPKNKAGKTLRVLFTTGHMGDWDAINPQFVLSVNGEIKQGIDVNHTYAILTDCAKEGETYELILLGWSGSVEGTLIFKAEVAERINSVYQLYYDLKVPYEVSKIIEKNSKTQREIEDYLNQAVNFLDLLDMDSANYYASVEQALKFMKETFYGAYCGANHEATVCAIGHTHIDVAWLWDLDQTRQKVVRSFSTVLELMAQYPEYRFMSSQPQLYAFLKEEQPDLYKKVKEKVVEGQWLPEGAMWLEADTNLASGEGLVRQLLYGKKFFKEEFGIDSKVLWLPDVFGYSAALPQILKKCGVDYFITSKISWNDTNKMPHDTFNWEGIDGSEILSNFMTTPTEMEGIGATYNGRMTPFDVKGTWEKYVDKGINSHVITPFGYGDGGGGTTPEMLETARRLEKGIPGCPPVIQMGVLEFCQKLEASVKDNKRLSKWVGELYLEYHRGTYTTMSRTKRYNRKSEIAYQKTEFVAVLSNLLCNTPYPKEAIDKGWKTVLLNHFHDILPGSSIKKVYEDSNKQYENILATSNEIIEDLTDQLCAAIDLKTDSIVVFNPLGFVNTEVVEVDLPKEITAAIVRYGAKILDTQITHEGKLLFLAEEVPAKGYKAFTIERCDGLVDKTFAKMTKTSLDTPYYRIGLTDEGNIDSIYDKTSDREVIKLGEHTALQVFEDTPYNFQNWDIDDYYGEKMWEINDLKGLEILENGPVRGLLRIIKSFGNSDIIQDIIVYAHTRRIDLKTFIDWKQKDVFVKFALPTDIYATKATYEIQYGNIERPTHKNTSWDEARFEVCAHKWVDVSEADYGVSLLNDAKYGHDISEGLMRITLLKATCYPNPDADKEQQFFTISILPHAGNWREGQVQEESYKINNPLFSKFQEGHQGKLSSAFSLVALEDGGAEIEVVKLSEDGKDMVIRLYDYWGSKRKHCLNLGFDPSQVWECDMLENNLMACIVENHRFRFELKPYEIKTFRLIQ